MDYHTSLLALHRLSSNIPVILCSQAYYDLGSVYRYATNLEHVFFFLFFGSGLQCPEAYSLWGGVVPSPSIG